DPDLARVSGLVAVDPDRVLALLLADLAGVALLRDLVLAHDDPLAREHREAREGEALVGRAVRVAEDLALDRDGVERGDRVREHVLDLRGARVAPHLEPRADPVELLAELALRLLVGRALELEHARAREALRPVAR